MIAVNPYGQRVASILLDFFGQRTPWQRRLWAVGLVLGLREVLEGSEAFHRGVLSERALKDLCHTVEIASGQDPGAGSAEQRRLLQETLRRVPRPEGADFRLLEQVLERIERSYLERWSAAIVDPNTRPREERAARAVATHLLDSGFSSSYLHRWWSYRIHHEPGSRALAELLEDAHDLVSTPSKRFELLVAFVAAPRSRANMPSEWLSAPKVSDWLKQNDQDPTGLRQGGGMLLEVTARDPWAAIDEALERVERLVARISVGTRSQLQVHPHAWIRGEDKPFNLRRNRRGVEIHALDRENSLYTQSGVDGIDAALELIEPLDRGSPGTAVSGGWAAIESLLLGPGDGGDRGVAGDRLASFVACSFTRAELTTLAYAHQTKATDPLANVLGRGTDQPRPCRARRRRHSGRRPPAAFVGFRSTRRTEAPRSAEAAENRLARYRAARQARLEAPVPAKEPRSSLGQDERRGPSRRAQNGSSSGGRRHGPHRPRLVTANTTPLELAARARLRLDLLGSTDGGLPVDLLE